MRPLLVTLIGIYQILRGLLHGLFALSILAFAGLGAKFASLASEGNAMQRFLAGFGHTAAMVVLLIAIVHLVAGIGLLQMANWGRLLTLLFSALGLVVLLPFLHALLPMVFVIIDAFIILYLAMPPTKRAFQGASRSLNALA